MKKSKFFLLLLPFLLLSCQSTVSSGSSAASAAVSSSRGGFSGGGPGGNQDTGSVASTGSYTLDSAKWNYDSASSIYYQLGINVGTNVHNASYESMGIYVPAAYFNGTKNSDGTYTCTVNASGTVGSYTGASAPIVLPVNTPGYAGQHAPSTYSSSTVKTYTDAGFIYVFGGMLGKDVAGGYAPWGVTDLKAAIRTYRYNADLLPGNTDRMFTFGMSGGGAQSALMGATGDSPLYDLYLQNIGAPTKDKNGKTISDSVNGSMCWCPITSLDVADEAYEWNMGQFFSTSTRASSVWTSALSQNMASSFATLLNAMGLKNGTTALTLEATSAGTYLSGTYYDYLLGVISQSLTDYLSDTYGTTTASKASYVSSLGSWASYDASADKATVHSLSGFVTSQKNASKPVGAFDGLSRGQGENTVFRNTDATSGACHFDSFESDLLTANATKYSALSGYTDYQNDFTSDFALLDAVGTTPTDRAAKLYNPMYFLCPAYDGYGTSSVAKHWRIRTGIMQGDTALTTETNLALALKADSNVSDVDFATVWNKAHVEAERTGDAASNFISWVESCCA